MKKPILGFLLSFGISNTLFAEVDLIALATNGVYNEQSEGVKVLNDEEMKQVVGGFYQIGASQNGTKYFYIEVEQDIYRGLSTSEKRSVENEYKWLSNKLNTNERLVLAADNRGTYIAGYNTATKIGRDMSLFGNSTRFYQIANKNFR